MLPCMISNTSLQAFSSAPGVGPAQPAAKPHRPHGVQQARAQQPSPTQALQAKPGAATAQPGQPLPRGSLLDLSV